MQTKDYRAIRRTLSPLETHFAAPVAQRQRRFASLDERLFDKRKWLGSDHETRRTITLPRASKAGASALRLIRMTTPGTLSCAIVVDNACTKGGANDSTTRSALQSINARRLAGSESYHDL